MAPKQKKKSAPKATCMKKPAAKHGGIVKSKPVTLLQDAFDLDVFIAKLLKLMGRRVKSGCPTLIASTGCSGSGAPTLLLKRVLPVREVMASELNLTVAFLLQRNVDCEHVFEELDRLLKL
jgi:hypothetical protein